ncbi:MAG: cell division protein FtsZ [Proteobacteria bacterium]|nr:cell division protein FtsZ [Pseudomonadota bacterium]
MTLNLTIPQQFHSDFTPRITVIGVGGGGTNAVDNMIAANLQGVEFVVANTDAQQLMHSRADRRIQLGPHITQGLGAGAKPEIGRAAAEEAADELYRHLDGSHMVFITAGMGGGTGTGAAPVIARMARERNILTVGVVTKPFDFEGKRRARAAEAGIEELQEHVDTLIVIPNQNLFRMANDRTTWKDAFKMADQVLYMGVRGVTDLMMAPGQVNLDFADIRTVMAEMGKAMMGTGEADGENRAIRAAEAAINNPLLEDTSMSGARGLLINITGGDDMTLFEVDQAANRIREEVDEDANIIFGSAIDESLTGRVRVSVIATGIDTPVRVEQQRPRLVAVGGGGAMAAEGPHDQPALTAAAAGMVGTGPMGMGPMGAGMTPTAVPPQPGGFIPGAQQAAAYPSRAMHPEASAMGAPAVALRPSAPPHGGFADGEAAPHGGEAAPARGGFAGHAPRPRPGLFAAPRTPEAPTAGEAGRSSLFGTVTGVFRRRTPGPAAEAGTAPRQDPAMAPARASPPHEPRPEPAPASVRPVAGEDVGLEIPTFLRRQQS